MERTWLCLEYEIHFHCRVVTLKAGMFNFRNWWPHLYLWNIIIKYWYILETQTLSVSLTLFSMLLLACQWDKWDIWFSIRFKPLVFCLPVCLARSALVSIRLAFRPEMLLGNFLVCSNYTEKYCGKTDIAYTLSSFFSLACFFPCHKIPVMRGHREGGVTGIRWDKDVFSEYKTCGTAL